MYVNKHYTQYKAIQCTIVIIDIDREQKQQNDHLRKKPSAEIFPPSFDSINISHQLCISLSSSKKNATKLNEDIPTRVKEIAQLRIQHA